MHLSKEMSNGEWKVGEAYDWVSRVKISLFVVFLEWAQRTTSEAVKTALL